MISANDLRNARVQAGFRSQKALAEALGVSLRTVTAWEAEGGRVPPKEEQRVRSLLWPGPAPLSAYEDWELLNEIGRRLYRHSPEDEDETNPEPGDTPNPDLNRRTSGRIIGRGARKPRQD